MKTYSYVWVVFALVIIGCTKSTSEQELKKEISSVAVDYSVLLHKENKIEVQHLNADYYGVTFNNDNSTFSTIPEPVIDFSEGSIQTFYRQTADCKGEIISYDFKGGEEKRLDVFTDLLDCSINVIAIARHDSYFYVAYQIGTTTLQKKYVLRKIDSSSSEFSFVELELTQKPLQMVFSNNRLFVLTLDAEITNENNLLIFSNDSFSIIDNQSLGYSVKNIFKRQDGNIIISYEELHSVLNASTLVLQYVRYEESTAPEFHNSNQYNFDSQGNLYYNKFADEAIITSIPAIYNMESNLTTLYFYENFLRTEQINVEYKIKETTVVAFDDKNGFMLIGYRKIGSNELGSIACKTSSRWCVY
ncbi:hypothetical protein [Maribacter sp.]|uniref:hypothetical protein n=1 Tax=Maribacter sp. TaxID=1897614 RepID=UPI0025B7AE78|nr:hypothetical protein [Maribacter sp.]